MKVIDNPNYKRSKYLYSVLVIFIGFQAVILYWTFSISGDFELIMVIPPFIFLGFFILAFAFIQSMVPYKIILKNGELVIRSKLQKKSVKIEEIKGYDVDYFNHIRLILNAPKNTTKILPLAYIDRKTQREIATYFDLTRYKFKFNNKSWGTEKEDEDSDVKQKSKISFTITTVSSILAIILTPIFVMLIFISIIYDINMIFMFIIFGAIMVSIIPIFMLAHRKGWIKRKPIKE